MRVLKLCHLHRSLRRRGVRRLLPVLPVLPALLFAVAFPGMVLAEGFEGFGGFEGGGFGGFEGNGFEGDGFEGEGGFGALAAMALTVNMAYIPYRWLRGQIPQLKIPHALTIHCAAGAAALVLGTLHALTTGGGNALLWLGLLAMAYETAAGFVLRARNVSREVRRGARLLHAQRLVFYAMLALLFVGHAFVSD